MRRHPRTTTKSGGRVGIKLFDEMANHAPASLTWREVWVLGILAKEANDGTRLCWPGFDDEGSATAAAFRARTRCSRSQFYATVKALVEKGAVEVVRRGQKHSRAVYRILPQGPGIPDTEPDAQGPVSSDTEDDAQRPGSLDAEDSLSVPVSDAQGPGLVVSGSRFDALSVPVSGTPSPQSPQISSSLSLPLQLIHAADVVPESDERELAEWIIKTRKAGSNQWWRTTAANGDIPALAGAWLATRPKPTPSVAEVLSEHDETPVAAATARATYEPGEDKQERERARDSLTQLPPDAWEPLLEEAGRLLLAADYAASWNARRVLAARLLVSRNNRPIGSLYLPSDPADAHRAAEFALKHATEVERKGAVTEAEAELLAAGLDDERALLIHAAEILTRWAYAAERTNAEG